jgi:hypothetical protein
MTITNKNALTVTYGSFTIVLDGHENPFELLRQVTDYYRQVAMNDPNFGAIPSAIQVPAHKSNSHSKSTQATENKIDLPETTAQTLHNNDKEASQPSAVTPLVLKTPVPLRENDDIAQINAAAQALTNPEPKVQPEREHEVKKIATLKSRYPFRHFPARRPSGG